MPSLLYWRCSTPMMRFFSTRRLRGTLTVVFASTLAFLGFAFVYIDWNCPQNARLMSVKISGVSRVQRHALMEEDVGGLAAIGDVSWSSAHASNNRSFYTATRDNISVVVEKRTSKKREIKDANHDGMDNKNSKSQAPIVSERSKLAAMVDQESSRPKGGMDDTNPKSQGPIVSKRSRLPAMGDQESCIPMGNISTSARHSAVPAGGANRVAVQQKTKNNTSAPISANYRFEKIDKWSTWNIWYIDEQVLRKFRTLSRALLPRVGMGKDEIRWDSTKVHKCVKKYSTCKLDDKNAIRRYNTCAIVGNSGILSDSLCGGEIDAHDYVIRFSVAPTVGYEHDVGSKRNITFLNKDILLKISKSLPLPDSRNVYTQRLKSMNASTFMFAKGKNKEWYTDMKSLITIARKNKLCFTLRKNTKNLGIIIRGIISQEMPDLARHLVGGVDTTGMLSIFMASTFCRRINVYGFYPFSKDTHGKGIRYHYYDNVKPRLKGSGDNYPVEYMVSKRLHNLRVVNHVIDKCR